MFKILCSSFLFVNLNLFFTKNRKFKIVHTNTPINTKQNNKEKFNN